MAPERREEDPLLLHLLSDGGGGSHLEPGALHLCVELTHAGRGGAVQLPIDQLLGVGELNPREASLAWR